MIYTQKRKIVLGTMKHFLNYYTHIVSLIMQLNKGHMGWLMLKIYSNLYMSTREKG